MAGTESWPAPWGTYLQRVHKTAEVVFSYWELAQDLGDAPDPDRRDLWRRLLAGLAWPAGTVAFWPVCAPESGTLLAKPALFWRGVVESGVQTVAVFGRRANLTLFPDRPYRCRPFRLGGIRVLVLPEPADLTAGDAAAKRLAWDALLALRPR